MEFCFFPNHDHGRPHIGHCPHLGGAALGTLVLPSGENGQYIDMLCGNLDAVGKTIHELLAVLRSSAPVESGPMVTVFFDIDGTLIDTAGAGGHAMVTTLNEQFGIEIDAGDVSFAGRTDRSLIDELLGRGGIAYTSDLFERFCQPFLERLRATLPQKNGTVLPGVVELLEILCTSDQVRLGLITGNLRHASRIKLDHFELSEYFYDDGEPVGGFGDAHLERNDVARSALAELTELLCGPPTSDVWVVGDTDRDIECARAIGAQVLAVGTGGCSPDELASHSPDVLLSDLTMAADWVQSLLQ